LVLIILSVVFLFAQEKEKYITGKVIRKGEDGIEIDVGEKAGVRLGMQFEVYSESKVVYLPFSGKDEREVLVERKPLATIVVRKLYPDRALCELLTVGKADEIKPAQTVVEVKSKFERATNVTPFIDSLKIVPETPLPGQMVQVFCKVTDANDTKHLYYWSASAGLMYPSVGVCGEAYWLAPAEPGKYTLSVTVRDRQGASANKKISVEVKPSPFGPEGFSLNALIGYVHPPFLMLNDMAFDEKGRKIVLDGKERKLILFDFDNQPLFQSLSYVENQNYTRVYCAGGRYYLTEANSCSVHIWSNYEEIIKSKPEIVIGGKGVGNGYFSSPPIVRLHPTNGKLYILDGALGSIQVFDSEGRFINSFGRLGDSVDSFRKPVAIEFTPDNELLVLDAERKDILVFKDERFAGIFPIKEPLNEPLDIRFDYFTSRLIVLGSMQVSVIDRAGNIVARFGSQGSIERIDEPSALFLDPNGTIYVSCKKGLVLKRYAQDGTFLGMLGDKIIGEQKLYPVSDFAVSKSGEIFLLLKENKIAKLSEDGYVTAIFAGYGEGKGFIKKPVAMSVDTDGNLYVADRGLLCITKFSPNGEYILTMKGGTERQERIDDIVDMTVLGKNIYLLQSRDTYSVLVFDQEGKVVSRYPSSEFRLSYPWRLTVDNQNMTYIYTEAGKIECYDISGQRSRTVTDIRYDLNDMIVLPTKDILATTEDKFLLKITPSSNLKKKMYSVKLINYATRIESDGFGRVYILDGETSLILRMRAKYE